MVRRPVPPVRNSQPLGFRRRTVINGQTFPSPLHRRSRCIHPTARRVARSDELAINPCEHVQRPARRGSLPRAAPDGPSRARASLYDDSARL